MEDVRARLKELSPIPDSEWERLLPCLRLRNYPQGQFFIRAGEFHSDVGLVRRGLMRKFYVGPSGNEYIKDFAREGDLFGAYSSLLLKTPTQMHIEAVENTEVVLLDYRHLESFYGQHPCWERLGRRLAEIHFIEKEKREMELLLLSATERYQQFKKDFPGLEERVPQYLVASYLGITAVSLSRIRHTCPQ